MCFTLVATAKNEGPYILEWVAYHRMIGFDNILIFQNDSDDLTGETLQELDRIGAVTYRYNHAIPGRHQIRAYKRAARQEAFKTADWAMALDLDEFLQIHVGSGHLSDMVDALPEVDEILLNWRRFGHGGAETITDELVTDRFQTAEHEDRVVTHLTPYKAMFRPTHFERAGIHRPAGPRIPEDQIRSCNGSGELNFERHRFRCKDLSKRKIAQVNHYIVRDAASFVLKSDRGSAHQSDRDVSRKYWSRRNFNDQSYIGLSDRAPQIIAAMSQLNVQSGNRLWDLRKQAIERHQAKFDQLMKVQENADLYAFCVGKTE